MATGKTWLWISSWEKKLVSTRLKPWPFTYSNTSHWRLVSSHTHCACTDSLISLKMVSFKRSGIEDFAKVTESPSCHQSCRRMNVQSCATACVLFSASLVNADLDCWTSAMLWTALSHNWCQALLSFLNGDSDNLDIVWFSYAAPCLRKALIQPFIQKHGHFDSIFIHNFLCFPLRMDSSEIFGLLFAILLRSWNGFFSKGFILHTKCLGGKKS